MKIFLSNTSGCRITSKAKNNVFCEIFSSLRMPRLSGSLPSKKCQNPLNLYYKDGSEWDLPQNCNTFFKFLKYCAPSYRVQVLAIYAPVFMVFLYKGKGIYQAHMQCNGFSYFIHFVNSHNFARKKISQCLKKVLFEKKSGIGLRSNSPASLTNPLWINR